MKPEKKIAKPGAKNLPEEKASTIQKVTGTSKGAAKPVRIAKPKGAASKTAQNVLPENIAGGEAAAVPKAGKPADERVESERIAEVKSVAVSELTSKSKKPESKLQTAAISKIKARGLIIPPILLEGDLPPAPKVAGPGARYALSAAPVHEPRGGTPGPTAAMLSELPEGYGTQRLFLAARDPHWLYASWDLTAAQQRDYNERSRDGHLVLRVFAEDTSRATVPEVHVNPESRNFFVNVPQAETRYWAELGLYRRSGSWEQITRSQSTFTPPDAPSPAGKVEFATIPVEVTFEQVVKTVQEFVTENEPLLEAVIAAQEAHKQEEKETAHSARVERQVVPPSASPQSETKVAEGKRARTQTVRPEIPIRVETAQPWSADRRQNLERLIRIDSYRRVWMGSMEITELVRRQLQEELASMAAAELARAGAGPGPGGINFGVSSPHGGKAPGKGRKFWFKVNAELIVYGATEPDARVMIADRVVKLRPDGTFSFRFALPDGGYGLPAVAESADGVETRAAILEFSRSTEFRGEVETAPQDASLRSPRPENL